MATSSATAVSVYVLSTALRTPLIHSTRNGDKLELVNDTSAVQLEYKMLACAVLCESGQVGYIEASKLCHPHFFTNCDALTFWAIMQENQNKKYNNYCALALDNTVSWNSRYNSLSLHSHLNPNLEHCSVHTALHSVITIHRAGVVCNISPSSTYRTLFTCTVCLFMA